MTLHDAAASPRFRPNVAAIIQNARGEILVGERLDFAGAWQFPQGGIDAGESREEALVREMEEELGLHREAYAIIDSKGPYRYLFADGRKKRGFDGQEQFYFLLKLIGVESDVRVETEHQEFSRVAWIAPSDFKASWLPPFKLEVYQAVLRDFFGVLV